MKNSIKKWWLLAILVAISLFFFALVAESMNDSVVEKEGVLYFPDGNPVRNYEQLYIYENSR